LIPCRTRQTESLLNLKLLAAVIGADVTENLEQFGRGFWAFLEEQLRSPSEALHVVVVKHLR